MAQVIRKTSKEVVALGNALNDMHAAFLADFRRLAADVATATSAGTSFGTVGSHNDRSEQTVTAANASDLATALTLVNQIKARYEFHRVDTCAHAQKDTTNVIAAPAAYNLATAITLANELKTDYNAHRSQASVHAVNDAGNAVAASNASDQGTLNTLLNELKGDLNAHMASGPVAKKVRLVNP